MLFLSGILEMEKDEKEVLIEIVQIRQSKELHNFKNELGPVLYIVLPSGRKKHVCMSFFSKSSVIRLLLTYYKRQMTSQ
jgi:hypothetical protein